MERSHIELSLHDILHPFLQGKIIVATLMCLDQRHCPFALLKLIQAAKVGHFCMLDDLCTFRLPSFPLLGHVVPLLRGKHLRAKVGDIELGEEGVEVGLEEHIGV